MFNSVTDGLIWLGGVISGLAVIFAAWKGIRSVRMASDVLLGKWYGYSYFYDTDKVRFYKEIIVVRRAMMKPWSLAHTSSPCSSGDPLKYFGSITYHAPYLFSTSYERGSGDRTYEIGRLVMDPEHQYGMVVSIHLGDSYEETVHAASAYLWVRHQLDDGANEHRAPNELEAAEFRRLVARYIKLDSENLQIQLVPPPHNAH